MTATTTLRRSRAALATTTALVGVALTLSAAPAFAQSGGAGGAGIGGGVGGAGGTPLAPQGGTGGAPDGAGGGGAAAGNGGASATGQPGGTTVPGSTVNFGEIVGNAGNPGATGGAGTSGGGGAGGATGGAATGSTTVTNATTGGLGGDGGAGTAAAGDTVGGAGGGGGAGGAGITHATGALMVGNRSITGGGAGNGGSAVSGAGGSGAAGAAGGGGGGGNALVLGAGGQVTVGGGGALFGGNGGNGGSAQVGGAAGAGGAGAVLSSAREIVLSSGGRPLVFGGTGGRGGDGASAATGVGGAGGVGGTGIAGNNLTLVANTGSALLPATAIVLGGSGGQGGNGGGSGGAGGAGGTGIAGTGFSITLTGASVRGGVGGNGGTAGDGETLGAQGVGGIAIVGSGTINNGGTIRAGTGQAIAIDLTGDSTLALSNGSLAGTITGDIRIAGALSLNGGPVSGTRTLSSAIIDGATAGRVVFTGGTVALTGANTYTNGTTISAGTLSLVGNGSLADTGAVTLNGGTFDISGANGGRAVGPINSSFNTSIALGANTLTINSGSDDDDAGSDINGGITGTGGLTLASGELSLAGNIAYTGATTVAAGTLTLQGANTIASSSSVALTGATSVLEIANEQTVNDLSGVAGSTVRINDGIQLGPKGTSTSTLNLNQTLDTNFAGNIAETGSDFGGGNLSKSGDGKITLSGTLSYTGTTTINAGTLALVGATSLASSESVTLDGAGVLDISGVGTGTPTTSTIRSLFSIAQGDEPVLSIAAVPVTAGGVVLGANTLVVTNGGNFAGTISGTGGLTLSEAPANQTGPTLTLLGQNTFSGTTTIGARQTLDLATDANGTGTLGNSTVQIGADGRLVLTTVEMAGPPMWWPGQFGTLAVLPTNAEVAGLSGSGTVQLNDRTLTLTGGIEGAAVNTFAGAIDSEDNGGIRVNGGNQTLTGNLTYNGATNVFGGRLAIAGGASLANSFGLGIYDGTVDVSGITAATTDLALLYQLGGTLNLGTKTANILGGFQVFGGDITGTGGITLVTGDIGESATEIGTALSYSGTTSIQAGRTLTLFESGSVANSIVNIAGPVTSEEIAAGRLQLVNNDAILLAAVVPFSGSAVAGLTGGGIVALNGGQLTLTGGLTGTTTTRFDGTLGNPDDIDDDPDFGTLTVAGGNQTLAGPIVLRGGIEVIGGTLVITGNAGFETLDTVDVGTQTDEDGNLLRSGTLDLSRTGIGATDGRAVGQATVNSIRNRGGTIELGAINLTTFAGRFDGAVNGTGGVTIGTYDPVADEGRSGFFRIGEAVAYSGDTTVSTNSELLISGRGSAANSTLQLSGGTLTLFPRAEGAPDAAVAALGNGTADGEAVDFGQVNLNGKGLTLTGGIGGAKVATFSGTIGFQSEPDENGDRRIDEGSLTVAGGTQTLNGDLLYSGATTVTGGTLAIAGGASLANSSVALVNGGTLDFAGITGGATTLQALFGAGGTVRLGATNLTVAEGLNYAGVIAGAGGLSIAASDDDEAVTRLGGANTYSGTTNVAAGRTLALVDAGSIANSSVVLAGNLDIAGVTGAGTSVASLAGTGGVTLGDKTLRLTGGTASFAGVIAGSGGLTVAGANQTLTGVNTFTGPVAITGGTLTVAGGNALADTVAVAVDGGTFALAASETVGGLSGTGTVALGANTLTLTTGGTFGGVASGTGGLTVAAGNQVLTGNNTYTGTTAVQGAGGLTLGNGGTTGSVAGAIALNGGTLTINRSNAVTFANAVSGAGRFVQAGSGTTTVANLGTIAAIDVAAGTLTATGGSAIGDAAAVTVATGATFALANGETIGALNGTGAVALGANTLTVANGGSFGGVAGGTGGLTLTGGTLTLAGANTFTGAATINGGTLVLAGGAALADTVAVTVNAGTLSLTNSETIGTLNGTGAVALGANTLTLGGGTFAGATSGTGGLTKVGTGTFTASGALADTGTTTVANGAFVLASGATFASPTVALTGAGASFDATALGSFTLANLSGVAGSRFAAGATTLGGTADTTFAGNLTATSLTKVGAGTLALSGTNTTGAVAINAGTLAVSGGNAIGDTSVVTIATGARLAVNASETVGNLAGTGAIALVSGANLTFGGNNQATSMGGGIAGAGGLTKTGTGAFTLSGSNTATGLLALTAGRTTLSNGNWAGAVSVASGAALGGTGTTGALSIASGGLLTPGATDGAFGTINAASLTSGGTIRIDFGGNSTGSASDRIIVAGAVNITGGTIDARPTSATTDYTFNQYFALTAGTTFTGRFDNATDFVQNQYDPKLRQRIRYDLGQSAVLEVRYLQDLTQNLPTETSDNGTAVALALNGAQAGANDSFSALINALSEQNGAARAQTLAELSGEAAISGLAGTIAGAAAFSGVVGGRTGGGGSTDTQTAATDTTGRFGALLANLGQTGVRASADAGNTSALASDGDRTLSAWLQGYGVWQTIGANDGLAKSRTRGAGLAGGLEVGTEDSLIGVALGYGQPDTDVPGRRGKTEAKSYSAAVYGRSVQGDLSLTGTLSASRTNIDISRSVVAGALTLAPRGETRASNYGANATVSYGVDIGGGAQLVPMLSADYQHQRTRGFTETGGGAANLTFRRTKLDRLVVEGGLGLTRTWTLESGTTVTPNVRGGYALIAGDRALTTIAQFAGAPVGTGTFLVGGARLPDGWATAGAGLTVAGASSPLSASIDYGAGFGSRYDDHRISGTVRYRF